jgi:hypothetical protein
MVLQLHAAVMLVGRIFSGRIAGCASALCAAVCEASALDCAGRASCPRGHHNHMLPYLLLSVAACALLHLLWHILIKRWQDKQLPVRVRGLPLLGSTVSFAQYGTDCLAWASAHARHAFQISLMFRSYVFLISPEAVTAFVKAPSATLSLQPAVSQFTERCFGLSPGIWQGGEVALVHALREILSPARVSELAQPMADTLAQLAPRYFDQSPLDLALAMPRWVMHTTMQVLFGTAFLERVSVEAMLDTFTNFDALFEVRSPCALRAAVCSCRSPM